MLKKNNIVIISNIAFSFLMLNAYESFAQNLPGSADPSRINTLNQPFDKSPAQTKSQFKIPKIKTNVNIPENAKQISFNLKKIKLDGMNAFTQDDVIDIYQEYIGEEVTLDVLWLIAGQITERYKNAGYFISRAYIPAQEIENGIVKIKIVEGYVAEVELKDKDLTENNLIKKLITNIKNAKPLSAYQLESFMLQLNALPGQNFRAIMEPVDGAKDGATRLLLNPIKTNGRGVVSFDNYGSKFLGPYQATTTYQNSFIPLQQTTLSLLASTPTNELKYGGLQHEIPFYPDWSFIISGSYVNAQPGDSLRSSDITSSSADINFGINWQPIRQRQENLIASLELNGRNTNGDILDNNPLTRDRIRTVRAKISYDIADRWNGYNYINFSVNQGLDIIGASKAGEAFLSRTQATPDFTTAQFNYTRQQAIYGDFLAIGKVAGQIASAPLFSAEEFGYGGQAFGKSYDPSEIMGDNGIAGSIELNYTGLNMLNNINTVPYGFYDIGKVWNKDSNGLNESGSSIGFGVKINHESGINANIGMAWPLSREISNPIYGNGKNPRILFQISYGF